MSGLPFADAQGPLRHVFLRDLVMLASIGVHPHEHAARQRVRINVTLAVADDAQEVGPDRLSRVVDYEKVAARLRGIIAEGHTRLVETLAEKLAAACLADGRVRHVLVRVEKPDVFPDVGAVGVEIRRSPG